MGTLKDDLTGPGIELRETHISWVFLGERDVWKVKKPVDLGFLDFRTLEARKAACEAEVTLNRRLAPQVYLGVLPVYQDASGHHWIPAGPTSPKRSAAERAGVERSEAPRGSSGSPRWRGAGVGGLDIAGSRSEPPTDYAVHMRRLPDSERADVMLAEGRLTPEHLERVARRVARFHAEQPADEGIARFGRPEVIGGNVRENFEQTRDTVAQHVTEEEAAEIERWQTNFLETHAARFTARIEAGNIRDGHGDLRLEHIYFPDTTNDAAPSPSEAQRSEPASSAARRRGGLRGLPAGGGRGVGGLDVSGSRSEPEILDCIEFNERFRYADVASDVAFLSMDLAYEGRVDLAELFLAAYAREAGDFDLYGLCDFYESYRAYVRAKVSSMLAADEGADSETRERASKRARRHFLLALAAERRPLVEPSVVAVGGLIASGKSTLAGRLMRVLGAPVIDADRTRKQLLGAEPGDNVAAGKFEGAYDPAFTEKVYAEMRRRAGVVLASGRPVLLDASFKSRAHREAARALAEDHGVPFRFVECRVAADEAKRRLARRGQGEVSDARADLYDEFAAKWEPVTELAPEEHIAVDTAQSADENLAHLRRTLPAWPEGLTS